MMHTETSRKGPTSNVVVLVSGHCKYTLSLSMDKMKYKFKFCNVNHVYQIIEGKREKMEIIKRIKIEERKRKEKKE